MTEFRPFDPPTFRMPQRKLSKVVIHCSASDLGVNGLVLVEEVERWRRLTGRDIEHHFVIDKSGAIYTGCSLEEGEVIDILVHGNWHFSTESLESLTALCKAIDMEYKINGKMVTFHGHCEDEAIQCPIFDYKTLLGLDLVGCLFSVGSELPSVVAKKACTT